MSTPGWLIGYSGVIPSLLQGFYPHGLFTATSIPHKWRTHICIHQLILPEVAQNKKEHQDFYRYPVIYLNLKSIDKNSPRPSSRAWEILIPVRDPMVCSRGFSPRCLHWRGVLIRVYYSPYSKLLPSHLSGAPPHALGQKRSHSVD